MCASAELVQWSVHRTGDEVTVALVGEVDFSNEAALGLALAEVVGMKPARVTIDLAGVSFLDASGVRCLLNVAKPGRRGRVRDGGAPSGRNRVASARDLRCRRPVA